MSPQPRPQPHLWKGGSAPHLSDPRPGSDTGAVACPGVRGTGTSSAGPTPWAGSLGASRRGSRCPHLFVSLGATQRGPEIQRRPRLTKPRQSPPRGLPGQTLESTASGHQGAEDETVRPHPGGRQDTRFLLVLWHRWATPPSSSGPGLRPRDGQGQGCLVCHRQASSLTSAVRATNAAPGPSSVGTKGHRVPPHSPRPPRQAAFSPDLFPPYRAA